jgi:chromate transporter
MPASVNVASLVLTIVALLAVFRFKAGMIPALAACSIAGVLLYLVVGVTV